MSAAVAFVRADEGLKSAKMAQSIIARSWELTGLRFVPTNPQFFGHKAPVFEVALI